jgi:colanic acid biosynthesis glycosyl transferase WcaI
MSKNKKILVVCQHFWPETFRITDVCEYFVEKGYSVDVLCGIPNYPAGAFFEGYGFFKNRKQTYKGIRVYRALEIPRGNNTNIRILLNFVSFTLFSILYTPLLLFKKYDRVFVYQLSPVSMSIAGIIIAKLKRKKLYIYICDFWPHSLFSIIKINNKALRWLITKASYWHYRRANGVIGVFKGIQKMLVSDVGIPEEKTLYVPQVAEKVYEGVIPDKDLAKRFKGNFNIVFAGSINPAQSFDTVLDATEVAIKEIKNLHFIIVGDGMSKEWLVSEVNRRHLTKFFTLKDLFHIQKSLNTKA